MMRALYKGLGIPAEVLLHESGTDFPNDIPGLDWASFPIREMIDKGWILTDKDDEIFLDELEPRRIGKRGEDPKEKEADAIAQNALIPEDTWNTIDLNVKKLD